MRALRSYGAGDIRVVDVDEPTPSDDKVIVEVEWCGICGSDLHLWHMGPQNMLKLDPSHTAAHPLIMGHEIAGRIPVPFPPLMYREANVTASCAYNEKDFEEVVKAFSEGRFKGVESMITARISLEDVVEKGFGALDDPNNSHVKILITPKKANLV
ncbi:hypothetical protein SLS56_007178 [Neofusicoccum ribis]|uniref:Alcohol dehydrogenase-like N-terminal domain-containing protein n=1 Tax=Neofusicoccum ribis TaxID=45134 RepID=A0ABR3SNQ3_9PEZI